jgi:hypothetical protein
MLSLGIGIVSVMTDTHITILMSLVLCQWDRYTYYYSIGIVSLMTDTHITILMALVLYQWWPIHILLFWWHHNANVIRIVICVSVSLTQCQCHQNSNVYLSSLTQCQCHQISNMCICHHWHNANAIRLVICVSVITYIYNALLISYRTFGPVSLRILPVQHKI